MFYLKMRMYLLLAAMFAVVYAAVSMISYNMGVQNFYFYAAIAGFFMLLQYLIGPKIVEWSMRVKYVDATEQPKLHRIIEELSQKAGIPKPKIGIAQIQIPNAFAFGRGISDGRICVTQGIMQLLDENELRAVLGHEISHLKNRDVLTITLLSVIPMIMYRIAWHFLFFGRYGRRKDSRGQNTVLIGLAAFVFYFITNLLVLYASRIREYFADRGSVSLGNRPEWLASALYKLVYGSARIDKEALKEAEGLKAFFVNDPSRALNEIKELSHLDLDRSGTIDAAELSTLQNKKLSLGFTDHLMEILSTHPNMLKRIKQLSSFKE
ncbi:MAG: M48 family metalloprotease [Elusimicrobia bacterium]|nr:M48 family metalloprotease [Elusimicrobiota bacterium]